MNNLLVRQLAWRYLRGKRTANAVPILSRISMVAIAVGAGAMIVLFSVFNGFEGLVKETYKAFYPDIKVTPVKGKFFTLPPGKRTALQKMAGIKHVSYVIEDNVLAREDNMGGNGRGSDNQLVVTLKGIDADYLKVNNIKPYLLAGADSVSAGSPNTAIAGERIIKDLGVDYNNVFSYVMLYYLDPTVTNPEAAPDDAFASLRLHPAGAFSVLDEFDSKYILAPLPLAQQLFHAPDGISSVEIAVDDPGKSAEAARRVADALGPSFTVATRFEQNKTMYLVMRTEKWAVYLILLLVLLIASFNMVGALTMLVLEKRKDIAILTAMGATPTHVRRLFVAEGVLWSLVGGLSGLVLGCGICMVQQRWGLIKINGSFLVDAYPVKMMWTDVLLVLATVLAVGVSASVYPAYRAANVADPSLKTA
jgi:lipoprotein-releasing system permease protein